MIEALQFEFMRNALLAGLLTSIACGMIGTLVVVNRIVFISGGISFNYREFLCPSPPNVVHPVPAPVQSPLPSLQLSLVYKGQSPIGTAVVCPEALTSGGCRRRLPRGQITLSSLHPGVKTCSINPTRTTITTATNSIPTTTHTGARAERTAVRTTGKYVSRSQHR